MNQLIAAINAIQDEADKPQTELSVNRRISTMSVTFHDNGSASVSIRQTLRVHLTADQRQGAWR